MFASFYCRRSQNDQLFSRLIEILKEEEILDYSFTPSEDCQESNEEIVESFKRHGKFSAYSLKSLLDNLEYLGAPVFIGFAFDDCFQIIDTTEISNSGPYCLESNYLENYDENSSFSFGLKSEIKEFLEDMEFNKVDDFLEYASEKRGDSYFYLFIAR